jgi:hypothetical protein
LLNQPFLFNEKKINEITIPCVMELYKEYTNIPYIRDYNELSIKFIGYIIGIIIFGMLFVVFSIFTYKFLCDISKIYLGFLILMCLGSLISVIIFSCLLNNFIKDGEYEIIKQIDNDPFWN